MKKNKIDVIMGNGKLLPGKQLEVTDEAGKKQTLSADHIIIATGANGRCRLDVHASVKCEAI